ncbi:MAG: hypothetical protein ACK55I_44845, partial [bacterium]
MYSGKETQSEAEKKQHGRNNGDNDLQDQRAVDHRLTSVDGIIRVALKQFEAHLLIIRERRTQRCLVQLFGCRSVTGREQAENAV